MLRAGCLMAGRSRSGMLVILIRAAALATLYLRGGADNQQQVADRFASTYA
jgi:hypothetical protein